VKREDLSAPRQRRRIGVHYDPEQFGQFSETIARTLGTARFLIFQTVFCALWLSWNLLAPVDQRFDPNPFGVLTLALSLQAAYAAPLILLAQDRQERRDRIQTDLDRRVAERTQVDTEFLARELASVRLSLADVATSGEVGDQLDKLTRAVERMADRLDDLEARTSKI
jgi:uncharacterized membrane protein